MFGLDFSASGIGNFMRRKAYAKAAIQMVLSLFYVPSK